MAALALGVFVRAKLLALLVGTMVLAAVAAHASVSSSDYDSAEKAADRALKAVAKPERAAMALARCRDAFHDRDPVEAPTWCWSAWRASKGALDASIREETTTAALVATGGIDSMNPMTVWTGDPALSPALVRAYALALINASRSQAGIPAAAYRNMARALGLPPPSPEIESNQRLQLLKSLSTRPIDSAGLWVAAAVAATYGYGQPQKPEEALAYYKALADALAPFLEPAKGLNGWDTALYPELSLDWAQIEGLSGRAGRAKAAPVRQEGLRQCEATLWPEHFLCYELRYRIALGSAEDAILALHPEWVRAGADEPGKSPPQITGKRHYDEYTNPWRLTCRVIVRYDIDDTGVIANMRQIYSDPTGACDAKASKTTSGFSFAPRSSDRPDEIRTNLIKGYARSPVW